MKMNNEICTQLKVGLKVCKRLSLNDSLKIHLTSASLKIHLRLCRVLIFNDDE